MSEVRQLRSRLGHVVRRGTAEEEVEVRRALATAKIARYIEDVYADAPPLTDDQCERLVSLIRGEDR